MSDTDSDSEAAGSNDEKSTEQMLIKQLARKLYMQHGKHANGAAVAWRTATEEERKLWWGLAKSAVQLMKKDGYTKA